MQIDFITEIAALTDIRPSWNDLLQTSIIDVPFLRNEYLSLWWETLGGGEWDSGKLMVAVGSRGEDKIVGLAPFFQPHEKDAEPRLMSAATAWLEFYQGFWDDRLERLKRHLENKR